MESACGTHLGHNLPENGVDRYCIDLVCIAGTPTDVLVEVVGDAVEVDNKAESANKSEAAMLKPEVYVLPEGVLLAEDFNGTAYISSAEQYSGKTSNTRTKILIFGGSVVMIGIAGYLFYSRVK